MSRGKGGCRGKGKGGTGGQGGGPVGGAETRGRGDTTVELTGLDSGAPLK